MVEIIALTACALLLAGWVLAALLVCVARVMAVAVRVQALGPDVQTDVPRWADLASVYDLGAREARRLVWAAGWVIGLYADGAVMVLQVLLRGSARLASALPPQGRQQGAARIAPSTPPPSSRARERGAVAPTATPPQARPAPEPQPQVRDPNTTGHTATPPQARPAPEPQPQVRDPNTTGHTATPPQARPAPAPQPQVRDPSTTGPTATPPQARPAPAPQPQVRDPSTTGPTATPPQARPAPAPQPQVRDPNTTGHTATPPQARPAPEPQPQVRDPNTTGHTATPPQARPAPAPKPQVRDPSTTGPTATPPQARPAPAPQPQVRDPSTTGPTATPPQARPAPATPHTNAIREECPFGIGILGGVSWGIYHGGGIVPFTALPPRLAAVLGVLAVAAACPIEITEEMPTSRTPYTMPADDLWPRTDERRHERLGAYRSLIRDDLAGHLVANGIRSTRPAARRYAKQLIPGRGDRCYLAPRQWTTDLGIILRLHYEALAPDRSPEEALALWREVPHLIRGVPLAGLEIALREAGVGWHTMWIHVFRRLVFLELAPLLEDAASSARHQGEPYDEYLAALGRLEGHALRT